MSIKEMSSGKGQRKEVYSMLAHEKNRKRGQ
jgi:hypothetical protein